MVGEIYIPKLFCVAASMESISLALKTPIKFHSWELSFNRFQSRSRVLIAAQRQMLSTTAEHQPKLIEKRDAGHTLHLQDNIEARGFYQCRATGRISIQNRKDLLV